MQVGYEADGTGRVTAYERGDLVRLTRDERGAGAMGRAGDWGLVEECTRTGRLTIRIAGYSVPEGADIKRLTGITPDVVEPCDRRGKPAPLKPIFIKFAPSRGSRSMAVSATRWSTWPIIALVSCALILAVWTATTGYWNGMR